MTSLERQPTEWHSRKNGICSDCQHNTWVSGFSGCQYLCHVLAVVGPRTGMLEGNLNFQYQIGI